MPKYFEYVFASYGIWLGVFALYVLYLFRSMRSVRRALGRLSTGSPR